MSRITIRMPQHYDEIGQLTDLETMDEYSGYHYYDEDQLAEAGLFKNQRYFADWRDDDTVACSNLRHTLRDKSKAGGTLRIPSLICLRSIFV